MSARVRQTGNLDHVLENLGERSSKRIRRVMCRAANDVADEARARAPVDVGNLEAAIQADCHGDRGGINRRILFHVFVDEDMAVPERPGKVVGDYAMIMHEGYYQLGELSAAKAAQTGKPVGRKYLEGALDELEDDIVSDVEAALRRELGL